MTRSSLQFARVLVLLALAVAAQGAFAAPSAHGQAPDARERIRRAIARFEGALATTDPVARRSQLEAALAELDEANRLDSETLIEWNLARVEQELGRPVRALEHVEVFLRDAPAGHPRRTEAAALAAALRPRVASVWVETQVAGARVLIDGEVRGTAPLTAPIRVPAGEVTVEVSAPGYQTGSRRIRIAGETESHVRVELELEATALGEVRIRCALLDVQITIDDQVRGTTPIEGTAALTPGTHLLIAEREGYRRTRRTIEVELGAEQTIDVTLEPDPDARLATLALRLPRARTELTIDGAEFDVDDVIRLPAGRHLLELDVDERQDWTSIVTLTAGHESAQTPDLRWEDEIFAGRQDNARTQRIIGVVAIGAGSGLIAASVAVVLHGVLLAASNRDDLIAENAACARMEGIPGCLVGDRLRRDSDILKAADTIAIDNAVGVSLLLGAAIALPIGIWLFADAPSDGEIRTAAHASLRLGPANIAVVGTF